MMKRKPREDTPKLTPRTFIEPLLFLAPFLVGLIIFTVYPFINVILISFKGGQYHGKRENQCR